MFAALQALQHPKVAPLLEGRAYPAGGGFVPKAIGERGAGVPGAALAMTSADRVLTVGVVGLGPVGVVSLNPRLARHLITGQEPVAETDIRPDSPPQ